LARLGAYLDARTCDQGRVLLVLSDLSGQTVATDSIENIKILNSAPSASISSPTTGAKFCKNDYILLEGVGTDLNQTLEWGAYSWSDHCLGQNQILGVGKSFATSQLGVGIHDIVLTVTDDQGSTAQATMALQVLDASDPQCGFGDQAPIAYIVSPAGPYDYLEMQFTSATYHLLANAFDREDPSLTGKQLAIEWEGRSEFGELLWTAQGADLIQILQFSMPCGDWEKQSITLKVTDSANHVTSVKIEVFVPGPAC